MFRDRLGWFEGSLRYTVDGGLSWYEVDNLVVDAAKTVQVARMVGASLNPISHFALGAGTTTPVSTDSRLDDETFREAFTSIASATSTITLQYQMQSAEGNGETYREAGIFNAASGGEMIARVLLSPEIVKTVDSAPPLFEWVLTLG